MSSKGLQTYRSSEEDVSELSKGEEDDEEHHPETCHVFGALKKKMSAGALHLFSCLITKVKDRLILDGQLLVNHRCYWHVFFIVVLSSGRHHYLHLRNALLSTRWV